MIPRPPRSTRTDTLFPYTTLFLSPGSGQHVAEPRLDAERYERLLPYAVALDVEEAWTGKFTLAVGAAAAAASAAAISWYRGGAITDMGSFARSVGRSEEHTSELQSLMRTAYAVFCLKKKKNQ